jgi:drug/metabolite transporter (DMT)-like permease
VRSSPAAAGTLFATVTGLTWGGQFVVGKSALGRVDAFHLTTLRYLIAALLLLALLAWREGARALRLDGRGLRLLWLGTLGFAGFNLLAYTGLDHARPESAALVVALAPLLTALVLWARDGTRPTRATFVLLAIALVGVAFVIGRGDPLSILTGSVGWGDALVLGGVLSFVFYTLGAAGHRDLSPLRYTTLTAALGWFSIAAATAVGALAGWLPSPSASDYAAVWLQIAYITILGAVVAVVSWNAAVTKIGPLNASLFGNLIPVTAFAIEIARGYRPHALEFAGAALTLAALVAANLLARRAGARKPAPVQEQEEPALAEAA